MHPASTTPTENAYGPVFFRYSAVPTLDLLIYISWFLRSSIFLVGFYTYTKVAVIHMPSDVILLSENYAWWDKEEDDMYNEQ
ncbi:hypothetical protein HUG20_15750 [Salicibibacter cibi]|uniref:Transmembrane protein n=1 Tax=Salicibibacter cibi TaxID=2743001 RepID=A0A7T7CGI0_9BACI|nr:hypothetical protein [Salicibibacter cibi]QQK81213.1 hypothetical protein HUG20_15750 [Salicibibacter cibi]